MASRKNITLDVKSVTEKGTFEATLSAYGVVDLAKEMTEKGCFDETIREDGQSRVCLWNHDGNEPIGSLELLDDTDALRVLGKLCLSTRRGKEARDLMMEGVQLGMSIGYIVREDYYDNAGVRHLTNLKLLEGSITPLPCNQSCQINLASVKNAKGEKMTSRYDSCKFLAKLSEEDRDEAIAELVALDEAEAEEDEKKKATEEETPQEAPKEQEKSETEETKEDEEDEKSFQDLMKRIETFTTKLKE